MFLLARVETTEMSLQYLEKIRSKLRSLTLSESNRPTAGLAKSSDERQAVKERHKQHNSRWYPQSKSRRWKNNEDMRICNKSHAPAPGLRVFRLKVHIDDNVCKALKNARCWSPQKTKSPKIEEEIDNKKTPSQPIDSYSEEKIVFTMGTSRSQPSPKTDKRNEEKKVKKLKAKDTKLIKEKFVNNWDKAEGNKYVGKVRRRWGWEKREGELLKKRTDEVAALDPVKTSVEIQDPELCKCDEAKDVSLMEKDFCNCEKVKVAKICVDKSYSKSRKRKPNTAPHLTDSLIVYKERMSRKSDRYDKVEDEVTEFPVKKKEGKGVSFSKDVMFRKRKNLEESLITLYHNSSQKKSACGLTKEQFERINSCSPQANKVKGKLL